MKKLCCVLLGFIIFFSSFSVSATNFSYNGEYIEADTTDNWENGFCYYPIDEMAKTAILVDFDREKFTGADLSVPAEISGYKIIGFANWVFSDSNIKTCDISAVPVTKLDMYMFQHAHVEKVILPQTLKEIERGCFATESLKEIVLPEGLEIIGQFAFGGSSICEIVIPSTVKSIGIGAFEQCDYLEKIEFEEGALNEIIAASLGVNEHSTFMTSNLKTLILPPSITKISDGEFRIHASFKGVYQPLDYPKELTIYGEKGSYAEEYARKIGRQFIEINSDAEIEKPETDISVSEVDISEYTESDFYHVEKIIPTNYGTVVYFWPIVTPHGKSPNLTLIKEDGSKFSLSAPVSRENLWNHPEHENIALSEDGIKLTFSVSFDERSEGSVADGEIFVLHDAGTYYYETDLRSGETVEKSFEPIDPVAEGVVSAWAKDETEKAIELGFVPVAFREDLKRNITRSEFARLAMNFLMVQYGYQAERFLETWYDSQAPYSLTGYLNNFMDIYSEAKPDRNGNKFQKNEFKELILPEFPFEKDESFPNRDFVEMAYNIGIVNGISENSFKPNGNITRQEAAAMLMRVYKNYATMQVQKTDFVFEDDLNISDWAKEDVYGIYNLGIMQGVGEDIFAPLDNYTIEQAVITFYRLYENAPVSRKNKNITPLEEWENIPEGYFIGSPGNSGFTILNETDCGDYVIVYGRHWARHQTREDFSLYVFYKYGGMLNLTNFISHPGNPLTEYKFSEETKEVSFITGVEESFKLYNKINGCRKVYAPGIYKFRINLETGYIIDITNLKYQ